MRYGGAASKPTPTRSWSGCVRTGVNSGICARAAVAEGMRVAIAPYLGAAPRASIERLLKATARQAEVTIEAMPDASPMENILGRDEGGSEGGDAAGGAELDPADAYMVGATDAVGATVFTIAQVARALIEELPELVRA